jgi:hypothetical protein
VDGAHRRSGGLLVSGRAGQRRSLLWTQLIAGLVAAGATGGMATTAVWQLAGQSTSVAASRPPATLDRGGGSPPLYPELPVLVPETRPVPWNSKGKGGGPVALAVTPRLPAAYGIPGRVLAAYRNAVKELAGSQPGCGLPLPLLAAIGRVESGHARGGDLDTRGRTRAPILGPRLDGSPGVMAIPDTDGGTYDSDPVWDRAVGPAQFIPSTWRRWGSDGNGDGAADPHHVDDAWLAAGRYLCAAGGDLRRSEGVRRAVLAYNHSEAYLHLVLSWLRVYSGHIVPGAAVPDTAGAERTAPSPRPETSRSPQNRPSRQPSAAPERPAPPRPSADEAPSEPTRRPEIPPKRPPRDDPAPIAPPTDTGITPEALLPTGKQQP